MVGVDDLGYLEAVVPFHYALPTPSLIFHQLVQPPRRSGEASDPLAIDPISPVRHL